MWLINAIWGFLKWIVWAIIAVVKKNERKMTPPPQYEHADNGIVSQVTVDSVDDKKIVKKCTCRSLEELQTKFIGYNDVTKDFLQQRAKRSLETLRDLDNMQSRRPSQMDFKAPMPPQPATQAPDPVPEVRAGVGEGKGNASYMNYIREKKVVLSVIGITCVGLMVYRKFK